MRLVAAYITENDSDLLEVSLKSILPGVDKVYIVYSPTVGDNTVEMVRRLNTDKIVYITKPYPHAEKGANGIQRNKYLDVIKHHEKECFVLVLDSDEVVDDIHKLKTFVQDDNNKEKMFNIHMRHLVGDFQHEDSTVKRHYGPHRLFHYKEWDEYRYPELEHPVLYDINHKKSEAVCEIICIWHLAYAKHATELHRKYKNHMKKSTMHTPQGLKNWYFSHVFGVYPKKPFKITELPKTLIDHFELNDAVNFEYFRERGLETKHFVDFSHWRDHFKPKKVLMVGDGLGHRSYAGLCCGVDVEAFELSAWAVEHCPYPPMKNKIKQGDLLTYETEGEFDLVVAYDVLEHLHPDDLHKALTNMHKWTNKKILISVPFIGDPNLENDPTHQSKMTKEEWVQTITKAGFKVMDAPMHFLYRNQLLIGEKI